MTNTASHTTGHLPTLGGSDPILPITDSLHNAAPTQTAHTILELTKGSYVPTLPKCHKHVTQTAMFGAPSLILDSVPGAEMSGPVEMPVAVHICPNCGDEVSPTPTSDPSEPWITYPCCQSECKCCYAFGHICDNCGKVDDSDNPCCSCYSCDSCHEPTDDICTNCECCDNCCDCYSCGNCGSVQSGMYAEYCSDCDVCNDCCTCSHEDCDCGDCGYSATSRKVPGWSARGWNVDLSNRDAADELRTNYAQYADPVMGMADFYLSEYVTVALTQAFPSFRNVGNRHNGLRSASMLMASAQHYQGMLVSTLADAFLEYAFLAIGGEVRHHPNVRSINPTHGRENFWSYWADLGDKYGRVELLQDALDLFDDSSAWGAGYGGKAWADCTKIVLAYAKGDLDRKTFVDRCFALQHNGGSFLDKVGWGTNWQNVTMSSVSSMKAIGNAHAATLIGFDVLVRFASNDVKDMLWTLVRSFAPYVRNEKNSAGDDGDFDRLSAALRSAQYVHPTLPGTYSGQNKTVPESQMPDFDPKTGSYTFDPDMIEEDTFASVAETAPVSSAICTCDLCVPAKPTFAPNTTYKATHSVSGATLTIGTDPTKGVYVSSTGHEELVGAGTSYPDYLTDQNMSNWTVVSTSVPNSTDVPYTDNVSDWCNATDPAEGFVCTAHKGHAGDHVAMYGPTESCPTSPWPNEADTFAPKGPISENDADEMLAAELVKAGIPDAMSYSDFSLASLKIAQSSDPELEALLVVAEYVETHPGAVQIAPFCGTLAIGVGNGIIGGFCGAKAPTGVFTCTGHYGHSETLHAAYCYDGTMCNVAPWMSK